MLYEDVVCEFVILHEHLIVGHIQTWLHLLLLCLHICCLSKHIGGWIEQIQILVSGCLVLGGVVHLGHFGIHQLSAICDQAGDLTLQVGPEYLARLPTAVIGA